MIRLSTIQSSMIDYMQHDSIKHYSIKHDQSSMILSSMIDSIQHDSINHDSIQHDSIRHDSIKHDSIKHDSIKLAKGLLLVRVRTMNFHAKSDLSTMDNVFGVCFNPGIPPGNHQCTQRKRQPGHTLDLGTALDEVRKKQGLLSGPNSS